MSASHRAPRLVVRALAASFLTVGAVLAAVFLLLTVDVQRRVRSTVASNLDAGQQVFARVEARRQQDIFAAVSTLAENPTLKAALDTWQQERRFAGPDDLRQLIETVHNEIAKIAARVGTDVLAVVGINGEVVVSAGTRAAAWPAGTKLRAGGETDGDTVVTLPSGVFRIAAVPLMFGDARIGSLELGTLLDDALAQDVASLARAESAIVVRDRLQATTLPAGAAADVAAHAALRDAAVVRLGGEEWAIRPITRVGPATFLILSSVDAAAAESTRDALRNLAAIGAVAIVLAGLGSLWLARLITQPIDRLSASLAEISASRQFDRPVPATGTSRELDALGETFSSLMRSLAQAEAETQAAYLGAIRALAAALDARDPYTAGHSERVSALSVEMGRTMRLSDAELTTLRLGALLHDIGKIGVPDEVLRKETTLTAQEYELIRAHPVIGARILRSIPFLAPHLPIVELHHERPDGRGYPYGLRQDAIPLAARIVHVADAYDAMTSARAYRPGRLPHEALAELERCVGTDFDRPSVDALVTALPRLPAVAAAFDAAAFHWAGLTRPHAS